MSSRQAALITLTYAWLLGVVFTFLMDNPQFMTMLLFVLGLVCTRYVVVACVEQYRLMKELTEGPDLAPPTKG